MTSRLVAFCLLAFASFAAYAQGSCQAAMQACKTYISQVGSYCWGHGDCTCFSGGAVTGNPNGNVIIHAVSASGGAVRDFYCSNTCQANTALTAPDGSWISHGGRNKKDQLACTPDLCESKWQADSGSPIVCTLYQSGNLAHGTVPPGGASPDEICWNYGLFRTTGNVCGSSAGAPPSTEPNPPNNPSQCQQTTHQQNPPAGSAVCFKTDTKKFCTGDGKFCVPAMDNQGGGGGSDDNSSSISDPSRPTGSPPTGGCQDDPTGSLCAGNPPPSPDPPPTGPGNNCNGGSAYWSVNGWPTVTTAQTQCPPPTSSCPSGTQMVNGQCVTGCPDGQAMFNGVCGQQCSPGQVLQNGQCKYQCPAGQSLNGTVCVPNTSCPSGTTAQGGVCGKQCPAGQIDNGNGCVSACGAGTSWSGGSCVATCPSGSTKDGSGICQPNSCAAGQVKSNGQCVTQCPAGQHTDGAQCKDDNKASGGTDCTTPPVCTGDQALCNIDYQAWAARCSAGKPSDGDFSGVYTPTGDTVGGVMSKYKTQLSSTALGGAVSGFLTVNPTGSCPVLTIPAADFMGKNIWAGLNGNILCEGTLSNIMEMAGYVVLALAAFRAFRIAIE